MNCCNHNNNNNINHKSGHSHKGHMSHMWMMLLCCGAPIILLAAISLFGASFPGIRNSLYGIIPFICPIMMIAMLPMMFRKGKDGEHDHGEDHCQQENVNNIQDNRYLK